MHTLTHRNECIYNWRNLISYLDWTKQILRCPIGIWSEKAMASYSSTLAWKIPWMEEPGRLQSMGSLRIGHDWVTSLSLFTFMYRRRKWQPTPVILPGESWDGGAWWAAISAVTQSRTRLKRLSRSSSIGIWCCIIAHLMLYYRGRPGE